MENYFISLNNKLCKDNGEFLENGIKLENEEGNYTDKDFKKRIKEEVSGFINRSYDNIVVLAGAGASVVIDESGNIDNNFGKTVSMIAEKIEKELKKDSDVFNLHELAKISKYEEEVYVEKSLNEKFNLEDFLSNILTYQKYVDREKDKYNKTIEKIFQQIIHHTNYDYDEDRMRHASFIKTLSSMIKAPNKLTIVTTNYDTVFEDAADSTDFSVIDGFTFSHKPYFDSDMFEWNLVKDIPIVKTKELEYKKNIFNLLKIHGSLTWEREESKDRIILKKKSDVNTPIMIFPSSNKYMQSYQEPYFELFSKFQDLLKRPNTLLITTGFSFADNHISKMITQAITHNTGLAVLISDFNITQKSDNWKELMKLMTNNYPVAFLRATMNSDLVEYLGDQHDD